MPVADPFHAEAIRLPSPSESTNTLEERMAATIHVACRDDLTPTDRRLILRMLGLDTTTERA